MPPAADRTAAWRRSAAATAAGASARREGALRSRRPCGPCRQRDGVVLFPRDGDGLARLRRRRMAGNLDQHHLIPGRADEDVRDVAEIPATLDDATKSVDAARR